MASPADKRGKLNEEVFAYRATKDGRVLLSWHGKQVTVLSGAKAESFLAAIQNAQGKDAQLLMAKATGNFKRGNEKVHRPR